MFVEEKEAACEEEAEFVENVVVTEELSVEKEVADVEEEIFEVGEEVVENATAVSDEAIVVEERTFVERETLVKIGSFGKGIGAVEASGIVDSGLS